MIMTNQAIHLYIDASIAGLFSTLLRIGNILIFLGKNMMSTLLSIIGLIIKITISSIVIGLKNSYFPTNSVAKLLSDSLLLDTLLLDTLLSDRSIGQSHSKL